MRPLALIVISGLFIFLTACTPTKTPLTPTSSITPIPVKTKSHQAELIARVGKGAINHAVYSLDEKYILVAYDTGLGVLQTSDLEEIAFQDMPEKVVRLVLVDDNSEIAAYTANGNILFVRFDSTNGTLSKSEHPSIATDVKILYADTKVNLTSSSTGKYLAISSNKITQIWDLDKRLDLFNQDAISPLYYNFAFSADDSYLLLSEDYPYSQINKNYLMDLDSGEVVWDKQGQAVLSGGNKLMFWANPEEYTISPLSDLSSQMKYQFPMTSDKQIFSPDGSLGALILWSYGVVLFHTADGTPFYNYEGLPPPLEYSDSPLYLTNAGLLVSYTSNFESTTPAPGNKAGMTIYLPTSLDLMNGSKERIEVNPDFEITYPIPAIYSSPTGHHFLLFNRSSLVDYDSENGEVSKITDELTSGVTALTFSPDGNTLVAGMQYFSLAYFDTSNRLITPQIELLQTDPGITYRYPGISRWYNGVSGLAYFPDGKFLAAGTTNGAISLIQVDGNSPRLEINPQEDLFADPGKGALIELFGLAISPDGQTMATGGYENAVRLWNNPAEPNLASTKLEDSSVVTTIAYSQDGKLIATGTSKGFIRLWRPDGNLDRTLKGHTDRVTALSFIGDKLVSASEDGTFRFWNLADGAQTQLQKLGEPVTSLAIDSKREILVLGVQNGKTYIWDLRNNRWSGQLPGTGIIRALAISPDGSKLAIGSENGQLQFWKIRDESGDVLDFPTGEPETVEINPAACEIVSQVSGFSSGTFVVNQPVRLQWNSTFAGDCSSISEKSISEIGNNPKLNSHYTFEIKQNYSPGVNILQINADLTFPDMPGTYKYDWELVSPNGSKFPFSALITITEPTAGVSLPAPLYFISETKALIRLAKDGQTLTTVIESPVDCMDISPATGEIAYLSDDSLFIADPNGEDRRVLLAIAGCPSWSPDGTLIGYTLNGVRVINVSTGQIKTLATDLPAYGTQNRHYFRILDWSPYSNKFIASIGGWEFAGLRIFDVPTGDEFSIRGFNYPTWSRDGEDIYTAEYIANIYGWMPFIARTSINIREPEILMGDSETDVSGGFAPYETLDGRLVAFAGRFPNPDAETFNLAAVQMDLDLPGTFSYDPDPHPIISPTDVLWWPDGSVAIVKAEGGKVMATFPFSSNPNINLPVRGEDLRWNTSKEVVSPTTIPADAEIIPSATPQITQTELSGYSIGMISGAPGTPQQIYSIWADGSGLVRPYPTFELATPLSQAAWANDGKSMFVLSASGDFYLARQINNQFYQFESPEGFPLFAQTRNGGMVNGFSISPNGRYIAIVYTPNDSATFTLPSSEQRLGRSNLGFLDLLEKRWIDVYIPAISTSFEGNAAILLSPGGWSADNQELVVSVSQTPGDMVANHQGGIQLASFHYGGGGDEVTSLMVVNISGKSDNITLDPDPFYDPSPEYQPVWASDGLIYFYGTDDMGIPGLFRTDRQGKERIRLADIGILDINSPHFAVSPDGQKIVVLTSRPQTESFAWAITNTDGSDPFFLIPDVYPTHTPIWSPDGKQLAWFGYDSSLSPNIYITDSDGSHLTNFNLPSEMTDPGQFAWSPDGHWLAFRFNNSAGVDNLYVIRSDGSSIQLVTQDLPEISQIIWSPVIPAK